MPSRIEEKGIRSESANHDVLIENAEVFEESHDVVSDVVDEIICSETDSSYGF